MPAPTTPPWHELTAEAALDRTASQPSGLSTPEATRRLKQHGPNLLPRAKPPSAWHIAVRQFRSPLIYVLAVAALVSLLLHPDDPVDAIFIAAVLLLNALIGGTQEWKAELSSQALQALLQVRATAMRDGELRELDAAELVPGDVVWLEAGARVPADLRLLDEHGLELDESLLTGESMPVAKDAAWQGETATPLADRANMAYAGAMVSRGRAEGVVVATGAATEVGQLALDVMRGEHGRPPLLERMERFTRAIAWAVLGATATIGIFGIVLRGYAVDEMFLFAVALAVSAIPEGLPVALTVALSVATSRMASRGVIVRRLVAVEGLGSCTLIGSDKTGTLTCNQLTVRAVVLPDGRHLQVSGEGYEPTGEVTLDGAPLDAPELQGLARVALLCNEADLYPRDGGWAWRGDPTDVALLAMGHKLGATREQLQERWPQFNEIPFEPEHRYSASYHRHDGGVRVCVKGAPERVLPMCELGGSNGAELLGQASRLAEQGHRVLALAEGPGPDGLRAEQAPPEPTGLQWVGFVGMVDPLRPGAREAVEDCHEAGIAVCMITGDHPDTALAIARELGLAESAEQVLTGEQLEQLDGAQLREAVDRVRVFARTTPRQKLELVQAARDAGHFVAVTGDGVNDAPALRQANIGVAMGRSGTDVAREAAELVISDDNFATIVSGVEQGRIAYDNVRKVIFLLASTGAAEVLLLGLAVLTGWPSTAEGKALLPLLPAQILWLNLVTNGIQDVALAFEPGEAGVLQRQPRSPRERIFNRLMLQRTLVSAVVMALVAYGSFGFMVERLGYGVAEARNALLLLMVLFENVHIGNCRSETTSVLRLSPLRSPVLLTGTVLAFLVHMGAMQLPLAQRVLGVQPVPLATFATLAGLALSVLVAVELHKAFLARASSQET